jgi:hypothetical protein
VATVDSQHAIPTSGTERALAEVLAGVVQVNGVAVESHFFDDLGCGLDGDGAVLRPGRKRADLPSVSMKDIYRHPTIKSLAAADHRPRTASPRGESPRP